ncbi:hypothetical protein B5S31_g1951 [[Candida] boidinii]|nr:hypothetical protein B5S31_g1951 [[Candida] boidinii]
MWEGRTHSMMGTSPDESNIKVFEAVLELFVGIISFAFVNLATSSKQTKDEYSTNNMSEEIQLRSKELIDKYLNLEKKPITYKIISRVLSISSVKSKKFLAEYYSENKDDSSVSLTSIITGIAISKNENQIEKESQPTEHSDETEKILVKYISPKELSNIETIKTENFKEVWSVEPYSLLPNENLQLMDVINSNNSVLPKYELSPENLEKWGVIKNDIESSDLPTATTTSRATTATQTTAVSDPSPSNKDKKKASSYVSRKSTEERQADKEQIKKKPASSYVSRKSESSNSSSQKESDKKSSKDSDSSSKSNGYVYKSFKERQKEKEQLASAAAASKFDISTDADDIENNAVTENKDRKQTATEKKNKKEKDLKLQSMFDDMDDDMGDDMEDEMDDNMEGDIIEDKKEDKNEDVVNIDVEEIESAFSTNKKEEGKPEAEEEDFSFMDDSGELSQLMDEKTVATGRSATTDLSVEKYEDEDGFIVTRINKTAPTPGKRSATHPAPSKKRQLQPDNKNHKIETSSATKKSKSKASSSKQSNLMSFFGAKK